MTIGNSWLGNLSVSNISTSQDLATGSAVLTSTVLSIPSVVDRVLVKMGSAATEEMTICVVPGVGTAYSTVVVHTSTSGHTSFYWQPDRPLFLAASDYIQVNVKNTSATGSAYITMLQFY
jgi:hypothetical protein